MFGLKIPFVIQNAIELLANYLISHAVVYGRSGKRHRGMRSDRRKHILGVAMVMLRGSSLQHKGVICHFSGCWVRPMNIAEIATLAAICPKTVSRCIADLVDLGLVECVQVKRRNPETGKLEVSVGIRRFTEKFWKAIGLWDLYQKGCAWAKEHGKRKFFMPFKKISLKAKKSYAHVGDLVNSFLRDLSKMVM